MAPFDLLPLEPEASPLRRAWIEFYNMLAAAETAFELSPEDTRRLSQAYGVDLTRVLPAARLEVYEHVLHHRLRHAGTVPLAAELTHLARLLYLDPSDLLHLHRSVFGGVLAEVLADDVLTPQEQVRLYALEHALGLPADTRQRTTQAAFLRRLAHALQDGHLDETEAQRLEDLAVRLGLPIPEDIQAMLAAAAARWRARHVVHTALPVLELLVPAPPMAGEVCHFSARARWEADRYYDARIRDNRQGLQAYWTLLHAQQEARGEGSVVLSNRRLVLVTPLFDKVLMPLLSIRRVRQDGLVVQIDRAPTQIDYDLHLATTEEASRLHVFVEHLLGATVADG